VVNPFWPWLLIGEIPDRSAFIGGGVIVGAVLISIFGGQWLYRRAR